MTPASHTTRGKMAERATQIMQRMGFPDDARGPFVTELRASVAKQVAQGMRYRSAGTWAPKADMSHEARAKALLAVDWEIFHGHSYRVEAIDGFSWKYRWAWARDRVRAVAMQFRIYRDKLLRVRNPYGDA